MCEFAANSRLGKPIMTIIITGAGGLVGSHLGRALHSEDVVIALTHRELDITDSRAVKDLLKREQPSLVINTAVVGVDKCEKDPKLAEAINVAGPRNLAEACAEVDAEFLHFSSNYVFDGKRTDGREYTIADVAQPINIYGQTKLQGERVACAVSCRTYIIRTSWVFGSGKQSFLSSAYENLMRGVPIRAITDTYARVTYVHDLVNRTKEILARRTYGTYHVVNEGTCSYYDFALECARQAQLSGTQTQQLIETVTEAEMHRFAPRPCWTPMRCLLSWKLGLKPMCNWRSALANYLHK
jgi:dTDP-4-dehydrorhamnose reductase